MVSTSSISIPLGEAASHHAAMDESLPTSPARADAEACPLALAVSRGDEGAFRELYDLYHARLLRLAVVLCQGDECLRPRNRPVRHAHGRRQTQARPK